MSDVVADLEALQEMVVFAEDRLVQKDSYHSLVTYLFIRNDEARGRAWQKQLRHFSSNPKGKGDLKGEMEICCALNLYLFTLEQGLQENPSLKESVGVVDVSAGVSDDGWNLPF